MSNDVLSFDDENPELSGQLQQISEILLEENSDLYLQTYKYDFTQTWLQIRERLHENSGLHNPKNTVGILFDLTLGTHLESFEDFIDDHVLMAFILTSTQTHLDRIADEYGLTREENETDDELRQRIFNCIVYELSIIFLERQGFRNYSKGEIDMDSRIYITSMNPHSNNVYDSIPVTNVAKEFLLTQYLHEYTSNPHWKGW